MPEGSDTKIAMANGIDQSDIFLIFLTEECMTKVNALFFNNVKREFDYGKFVVAFVIFLFQGFRKYKPLFFFVVPVIYCKLFLQISCIIYKL